jgi:hypothetical protein
MKVMAAAWIELCFAHRTHALRVEILLNGQLSSTGPAQDSLLIPFGAKPDFSRMVGQGIMAIPAGVENAAALHFYRYDVLG